MAASASLTIVPPSSRAALSGLASASFAFRFSFFGAAAAAAAALPPMFSRHASSTTAAPAAKKSVESSKGAVGPRPAATRPASWPATMATIASPKYASPKVCERYLPSAPEL